MIWKDYKEVKRLSEADLPSEETLQNPQILCIDQGLAGKWVGLKWTHYADRSTPKFLVYGHDRKVQSYFFTGSLANAKKWIKTSDAVIDSNFSAFPNRKPMTVTHKNRK